MFSFFFGRIQNTKKTCLNLLTFTWRKTYLFKIRENFVFGKRKEYSRTAACRGSRQHFWQNDKIVAIRTMGFVILFPTLLWKECVLSYLLKMAKSRKVFASLLKKSSYILRRSKKYDENLFLMLLTKYFFFWDFFIF